MGKCTKVNVKTASHMAKAFRNCQMVLYMKANLLLAQLMATVFKNGQIALSTEGTW